MRQVVVGLIKSIRSLVRQTRTLHLQLGALRAILERKGTMSEAELSTTLAQLEAVSAAAELLSNDSVDETFDQLLLRVQQAE